MWARSLLVRMAPIFAAACVSHPAPPGSSRVEAPAPAARVDPEESLPSNASRPAPDPGSTERLVPDAELGPLMARLSEAPGDFPSDNFVSNETSYLDVAPALRDPSLRGRAYVGVGPEQNYTYLALTEPAVAYVVDLRRDNMLEHLVLRGCFEVGETRAEFLSALLARHPVAAGSQGTGPESAAASETFAPLAAAFASAPPNRALLEEGVARSRALLDRLHVVRAAGDDEGIARIHEAFFARGLSIAFEMKNSGLPFPTLGRVLAERDPAGAQSSFLASEERYGRVRRIVLANRVVPVVGDFGGRHALTAVAEDMRARGLLLGVLYASNVEQYLFDAHTHAAFVDNVRAMPRDDASLVVRVWLDPARPHPLQRPGHRTTSLTAGATAFVERAAARRYRSYWEVVTLPP